MSFSISNFRQTQKYCDCSSKGMDVFNDARLDEIIDLNSAEKAFMKLWNGHIRQYSVVGNIHMELVILR